MTKQARAVLYYLGRYLDTTEGAGKRLRVLFQKEFRRPIPRQVLWRHVTLDTKGTARADMFLFYLIFLIREKAIVPDGRDLFAYAHPSLLRARPAKR